MTLLKILTFSYIQTAITTLVIHYTPKRSSALDLFDWTQPLSPLMVAIVFGFGLHHFNLLCTGAIDITDVKEEIKGSISQEKHRKDERGKSTIAHTVYIAASIRGIGTIYEVKNINHGSEATASRLSFVTRNMAIIFAKYLFLDLRLYNPLTSEDANRYSLKEALSLAHEVYINLHHHLCHITHGHGRPRRILAAEIRRVALFPDPADRDCDRRWGARSISACQKGETIIVARDDLGSSGRNSAKNGVPVSVLGFMEA
ncbi:hypothetical protein BJX64DRAFT_286338 [Aspergillus heterothallicus]